MRWLLFAFASFTILLGTYWWFNAGPRSFQAQFDRDAAAGQARLEAAAVVTDADLAPLPAPVQQCMRLAGAVGQPRVQNYRLRFRGRIRSAPGSAWMPFEAEQQSFADQPTRLFHMRARMFGLPVDIYHRLAGGQATMQVRLLGAIPIVDARGDDLDRSEAVTLFNDMCLLAPGTLIDSAITWQPIDPRSVRAEFTHGADTIAAVLEFGDDGLLANFVSDDRSRSSPDGTSFTRLRFSTPVRDYRTFGQARLMGLGEARWQLPDGEFTYGEFELQEIAYNVPFGPAP
jgi:hypothetical protein